MDFAILLTAQCLGATAALSSVVMSGTQFGRRCCELSWGHGQCPIVLPTEEAWSANPTRGARTPFLNETFKNNRARARIRHATSQEVVPRTRVSF